MKNKIISLAELTRESARLRAADKCVVATNGCFDILHVGHVRYLAAARALGDLLIVGLNGDDSVRALKGEGRPINGEKERAEVLAALGSVDVVAIFPEVRATKLLSAARPAVYAKGGDYKADTLDSEERALLIKIGAQIEIIPFTAGYSTTALLRKMERSKA